MPLVIIADDDELVVDVVRAALEKHGYVVGALSDGTSLRSVVELKNPDVVILDCSMEPMSGISALKELRTSVVGYSTPVLMLTARLSASDENIARIAGAQDYLRKPFNPDELVALVDSLVRKVASSRVQSSPLSFGQSFAG